MKRMMMVLLMICWLVGCQETVETQRQEPTPTRVQSTHRQSTVDTPSRVSQPDVSQPDVSQPDIQSSTIGRPVHDPLVNYPMDSKTTVHFGNGKRYTFQGERSVAVTKLLVQLRYDPDQMCKCLPEYTIDTVVANGYGIHLTQGYARLQNGQVQLTNEQLTILTDTIQWAKAQVNVAEPKETVDPKRVSGLSITKYASPPGPQTKTGKDPQMIQSFFAMWNEASLVKADRQPKPGTTWTVKTTDGTFSVGVVDQLLYYQGEYYQLPEKFVTVVSKSFDTMS